MRWRVTQSRPRVTLFLALAEICADLVDEKRLTKGLRADGIGTVISGIFNRLIVQICLEALVARAFYSIAPMLT